MNDHDRPIVAQDDRPQYSLVPLPLLAAVAQERIRHVDIAVYAMIDRHRNRWSRRARPGLRGLAEALGLARDTLSRSIARLVAAGFIVVEPATNPREPQIYLMRYAPEPSTTRGRGSWPKNQAKAGSWPNSGGSRGSSWPNSSRPEPSSENHKNQNAALAAPGTEGEYRALRAYCETCGELVLRRPLSDGVHEAQCSCGTRLFRIVSK